MTTLFAAPDGRVTFEQEYETAGGYGIYDWRLAAIDALVEGDVYKAQGVIDRGVREDARLAPGYTKADREPVFQLLPIATCANEAEARLLRAMVCEIERPRPETRVINGISHAVHVEHRTETGDHVYRISRRFAFNGTVESLSRVAAECRKLQARKTK